MFARAFLISFLIVGFSPSLEAHGEKTPVFKKNRAKNRRKNKSGGRRILNLQNQKLLVRLKSKSDVINDFTIKETKRTGILMTIEQIKGLNSRTPGDFIERIRKSAEIKKENQLEIQFVVGLAVLNAENYGEIFIAPGKFRRSFSPAPVYSVFGQYKKSLLLPRDRDSLASILSEVGFRRDQITHLINASQEINKDIEFKKREIAKLSRFVKSR